MGLKRQRERDGDRKPTERGQCRWEEGGDGVRAVAQTRKVFAVLLLRQA